MTKHNQALEAAIEINWDLGMETVTEMCRQTIQVYLRAKLDDCDGAAKAIWNWEHEGRQGHVLDIEWSLLRNDYNARARCAINQLIEELNDE